MKTFIISAVGAFVIFDPSMVKAESSAVINEFHYNSEDEASLEEFIELYNPGDAPFDLTDHKINDAVKFTFPNGTMIPAGGYVVVAQDPAVMLSKFGVTALGPWTGKLSSSGENIQLQTGTGTVVDSVEYRSGFPWPTMADGAGPTVELINDNLDNNLGSSWRSATVNSFSDLIPSLATGWKYFKGITESPASGTTWTSNTFNDVSWLSGQAGFGYGPYDGHNTVLDDMLNQYTSIYLRKSFTISPEQIPTSLILNILVDDGCVVWINGTEVARLHVPAGTLAYNATAENHPRQLETITSPQQMLI